MSKKTLEIKKIVDMMNEIDSTPDVKNEEEVIEEPITLDTEEAPELEVEDSEEPNEEETIAEIGKRIREKWLNSKKNKDYLKHYPEMNNLPYYDLKDISYNKFKHKISGDFKNISSRINDVLGEEKLAGEEPKYEMVNSPKHYNNYSIEVIDMMRKIWGDRDTANWCEMTAFKYRMRMGTKPGNELKEDRKKEQWYLDMAKKIRLEIKWDSED